MKKITLAVLRKLAPGTAAALTFGLTFGTAPAATAAGMVRVALEIDGKDFSGTIPITTGPHPVIDGMLCDAGSNSATATTALADASDKFEFNVQATFDESLKDFVVTATDVDEADSAHQWNIYVNDVLVTNGGCHAAIQEGDSVKFTLEPIE
ncbi:hypothetical protein NRF20_12355 [Streptomyces sp. R-74717]|uniref:hypothetical protein n=1 Tax=Streptomyces sp. R-74717 TaxID=2969820 RepID=UPI0039B55C23